MDEIVAEVSWELYDCKNWHVTEKGMRECAELK